MQRRDIFFWSLVCLLTLLLSFGKHFFLYQLFYSLPMISSIRNPNKFIQVFQLSVAVLCAYGLHLAGTPANGSRAAGWFGSGTGRKRDLAFLVAIVLGMLALAVTAHLDPIDLAKTLEDDGWGGAAGVIVSTRVSALRHASIMTLVGLIGLGLLLAIRKTSKTRAVPWVLWLILVPVVLDVFLLREHYVETMSVQVLDKPSVTQALQSDRHHRRIALTTRTGFYNHWLTYLFPYHDIDAFNPTQMPRMPKDYGRFLAAMERTPVRMWELSAVGRVLAPTSTWRSMRDSGWSRSFEPVLHYDVAFDPVEPLEVHVTEREGGKHSVLQLKSAAPRYVLVHDWEIVPDNVALRRLSDPQFVPLTKVWVSTDSASDLPKPREVGITSIELATRGPSGETSIRASSDRPAILRIAERYLPGWQVQVDGEPVAPLRCDFLMLGVFLKPGDHEVRLRYRSSSGYLWFQGLGIALVVVGLVAISLPRQRA